jgi:hypothetical protein
MDILDHEKWNFNDYAKMLSQVPILLMIEVLSLSFLLNEQKFIKRKLTEYFIITVQLSNQLMTLQCQGLCTLPKAVKLMKDTYTRMRIKFIEL